MNAVFDPSVLWLSFEIHRVPILLGLVGFLLGLIGRKARPLPPGFPGVMDRTLSWLAIAVWGFQANGLVDAYTHPHWMNRVETLFATSQEVLGSFLVLSLIVLMRWLESFLWDDAPAFSVERRRRGIDKHTLLSDATLLIIVIQVILNWLLVELGWWYFAQLETAF